MSIVLKQIISTYLGAKEVIETSVLTLGTAALNLALKLLNVENIESRPLWKPMHLKPV